ncbi:hypothetical protein CHU_1089 [Cytophaga hutchinsonii ATCC 33406]|uniref:Uncharacterized protein n=1 Tax=Cytophaga hutchinsonii (strain ATCC 33406 / DSM 1761 / CIP 103989 / NBRC 15051 / NCIMB 9469 / D465) TaxID=269798 RepID=A0A6N4SPY7_CYTH3|nr:hypothetical protein CHU_1089 [Cytophaga hutchinsonii ATCC 33406]
MPDICTIEIRETGVTQQMTWVCIRRLQTVMIRIPHYKSGIIKATCCKLIP